MPRTTPIGAAATPAFIEELRSDLKKAAGDWPMISKMTRGRLPYHWIKAFAYSRIHEPSFERVVYLAQVMGKPLFVGRAKRYDQLELAS
ncbi:MAG: hypothetical protein IT349_19460 [Candidatus Eisenbacteria bacterium]|nr:hypothetical protein [Candidatus Eisenbacteria bacterium]